MIDANSKRKLEHIEIASEHSDVDRNGHCFDQIKLVHRALPEIDFGAVDSTTTFLDQTLSFPLLISAMTGGSDPKLRQINENLALAAEHCKVAMSVGSQRVSFDSENAKNSFRLREFAPNTVLLANLGAVQLNYGYGFEECQASIELLRADALVLHFNPLQELLQNGGNTNFSNLIEKIARIRDQLDVPVILKEVGAGFSTADAALALRYGLNIIDVAGRGGTSWSLLEQRRHDAITSSDEQRDTLGEAFKDWGIATPDALKLLRQQSDQLTLIASGGIRNGIDMVKAAILGAELSGMALPFLAPALESAESVIEKIEQLKAEFVTAMFLLGCEQFSEVMGNHDLLLPLTSFAKGS